MNEIQQVETAIEQDSGLLVWDKVALLKRISNNEKLLNMLVDVFINEHEQRLVDLQYAIDMSNIDEVRHLAHTLKGMAANLGGLALQHQASEMEVAATEQNRVLMKSLMPAVLKANAALLIVFKRYKQASLNIN